MAPQETGKQRAARIPLDYYKKPDNLQRLKGWLTDIAFVALVWLIVGVVWQSRGQSLYSRGPVAAVHAAWEDNCNACHTPFQPLSGESFLLNLRPIDDRHASEYKCQSCHAGPEHHASQRLADIETCAGCHRDHRGRDASLARLDDHQCTRCHANLDTHMRDYTPSRYENVSVFDNDHHPEFKIFRTATPTDPGKLKFNHQLHLAPGMVLVEGGKPWTLADIRDEAARARYRQANQQGDKVPVKLDCSSCHQTDGHDFSDGNRPTRASGAHMLPINYDTHCKACHPLTFDLQRPELAAPHREQPEKLKGFLWNTYAAGYLAGNPKLLEQPIAVRRPLPGKMPGVEGPDEVKARQLIQDKVVSAQRILYTGKKTCGECHYYEKSAALFPEKTVPTEVPEIWFTHAKFDHSAHRAMRCQNCHQAAEASARHTDVLVPGIENCLACHGPATRSSGATRGGARFDCTECHRYHYGDGTGVFQGLGAKARAPEQKFERVEDFLSGKK
jgi:hypothetical protein